MHTSTTTHHRIFFANVTKPDYLEGLCLDLGLEKVSDTIYDLVLDEGTQLSVEGACRIAVRVAALGNEHGDPEDLQFMLGCMARLLTERGYTPHSTTFDADVDLEQLVDQDISCLELFDLLSALSYGYEVRGIYSQWAMNSNKAQFGANAGGTRITMRDFSIPCQVYPDHAEGLIHLFAQHRPENIGDLYIMKLIMPLIEMPGILNKTMELSVHAALARFLGGVPMKALDEIIPEHLRRTSQQLSQLKMKDEYLFQSPPVLRQPRSAPTLDGFRNFQGRPHSNLSEAQQFYIAWFGVKLLDSGHCPQLPPDFELQVDNIRIRLANGEEFYCPAIYMFHNPTPIKIECEIPTIMPRAPEPGEIADVLDRGRDVIDRDTHRVIGRGLTNPLETHTFMGVAMEKTGHDWSQESSNRSSSPDPSPSPSPSDNDSSSSSSSD